MRIAHINVVASLSTGRIAVELCRLAQQHGHRALICHSRDHAPSDVPSIRVGSRITPYWHAFWARLTDRPGFFSRRATRRLIRQLEDYKPDLIHLHNVHGYYLHLPTLFNYLKKNDMPVVWTLHDCWAFTGHCAYYTTAPDAPPPGKKKRDKDAPHTTGCDRWMCGCGSCVLTKEYPKSLVLDRSARNWQDKRKLFTGLKHMVLTTPSNWLRDEVKCSFLQDYPVYVLPNGLDLKVFQPCPTQDFMREVVRSYGLERTEGKKLILSVAAVWEERKGLEDLIDLADALGDDYCVAAVGVEEHQQEALRKTRVIGIRRTGNLNDLCALYTAADVYVSASHEETLGMTLLEALACGTQILCYDATAMPEIVTDKVGAVVPLGDISAMADAVRALCENPKSHADCRQRAAEFESSQRFAAYMRLYDTMYTHSPAFHQALERAAAKEEE